MNVLKRPALGQAAVLGSLYDARNDSFVPISLLQTKPPQEAIDVTEMHSSDVKISRTDSYKEKFKHMDIDAGLSASFLAGLVDVQGSSTYLRQKTENSMSMQASLYYKITTVHQSLNVYLAKHCFALDQLEGSFGTHVVTDISWGAQCIVTAKCEVAQGDKRSEISGHLDAKLSDLTIASAGGHAHLSAQRQRHNFQTSFEVRVHGDVLADDGLIPTDFETAYEFIKNVPKYIAKANDGKGKPILYTLMPIEMFSIFRIQIKANVIITQLSFECLEKFVQLFDNIRTGQQKLNEYHTRVQNHRFCLPSEHIDAVVEQLGSVNAAENALKSQYATALTEVRSGKAELQKLWKLHENFTSGDSAPALLVSMAYLYNEKLDFVDLIEAEGARYVGYGSSLETELMRNAIDNAYVLYFNDEVRQSPEWAENVTLILDLLRDGNTAKEVLVVDCETTGQPLEKVCIHHLRCGQTITKDLLAAHKLMAEHCIMRYSEDYLDRSQTAKPIARRAVKIPCPSLNCHASTPFSWICFRCHAHVEYGHTDAFIYCDCGRCPYDRWEFKCNGDNHELSFGKYDNNKLRQLLGQLEPFEEVNILILGETGVGKSTWINAFINYLSFESLDQAINTGDLKFVIPFSFSTQDEDKDGRLVQRTVKYGSSEDEADGTGGASATQRTVVHAVLIGETIVRLIDTPGIGDTRGVDQDKQNMEDILTVLTQYPKLHGILILIKPNNARLTTMFKFCIKELLTHLHRNAADNMVFGFTNTRGSNYKPGDTFKPLETLLNEYKEAKLGLFKHTVYCFDSESFRYLAALKQGIDVGRTQDNAASWQWSVSESKRLVNHFQSLPPHEVQSTLSLNQARQIVLQLARPMAQITEVIKNTVAVNQDQLEELKTTKLSKAELEKRLTVTKQVLSTEALERPRTVCTNSKCVEYRGDGDGNEELSAIYKSICHDGCSLPGAFVFRFRSLRRCSVIHWRKGTCKVCSHHWSQHMHITYELRPKTESVNDQAVAELLVESENSIAAQGKLIELKKLSIGEFTAEHNEIQTAACQFSLFLQKYSITPFNDATIDYLDQQIEQEKGKVACGGKRDRLRGLELSRKEHEAMIHTLEDSMKHGEGSELLDENGVQNRLNKLFKLHHYGDNLKEIKDTIDKAKHATYREKPYSIRAGPHWTKKDGSKQAISNISGTGKKDQELAVAKIAGQSTIAISSSQSPKKAQGEASPKYTPESISQATASRNTKSTIVKKITSRFHAE